MRIIIKLQLDVNHIREEVNFLGTDFYRRLRQVHNDQCDLIDFARSEINRYNEFSVDKNYTLIVYEAYGNYLAAIFRHVRVEATLDADPFLNCIVLRSSTSHDVSSRGLSEMFRRFLNIRYLHEHPDSPELYYRRAIEFSPRVRLERNPVDQPIMLLYHLRVVLSNLDGWMSRITRSPCRGQDIDFPWPSKMASELRKEWKHTLQDYFHQNRFVVTQFSSSSGTRMYCGSLTK